MKEDDFTGLWALLILASIFCKDTLIVDIELGDEEDV